MKTITSRLLAGMLLTSALTRATAQTVNIDFEGLPAMGNYSGNPVPASAQLSSQLLSTYGASFTSESSSSFVAVVNLGAGHAPSGVNGIGGVDSSGLLSYATPFDVAFFLPSDTSTLAVTDFVSIRGDLYFGSNQPVRLDAFDANGTLLASDTTIDNHIFTLSVSHAGIHSIRVSEFDHVAWDDLSFGVLSVAVPEPSTIAIGGIGCVVLLGLRRRLPYAKKGQQLS